MVCAHTLGVTFALPSISFWVSTISLPFLLRDSFNGVYELFGINCWVAAMNAHFVTLGSNQAVQGDESRNVSIEFFG